MNNNKDKIKLAVILLIAATLLFALGYAYAVKTNIYSANEILADYMKTHTCVEGGTNSYGNTQQGLSGFDYSST